MTCSSDASTVAELDRLHAQLVGDLVRRAPARRAAPRHDEPAQRLAQLDPRRSTAPGARARRRGAPRRSRRAARVRLGRPRASRRGSTEVSPAGTRFRHRCVGEERHHRRDHAQRLDERVPERPERGLVVGPRNAAASGGCTSSRGRRRTPRRRGSRRPSASPRRPSVASRTSCVRPRDEPAVERTLRGRPALEVRQRRLEALDVAVARRRTTVEFQNVSSLRLISCAGPKPKSRFRSGGCAQYCQRITSAPIRSNASSASIMFPHEPCISRPVLVEHLLVAEHALERRAVDEHDRHEELRVEPEPDLLAHLGHPVGREPLLPVGVVGQVGVREPRRGAGGVAASAPTPRSPSRASRTGRSRRRARRRRPRRRARRPRRTPRSGSARGRSTAGAAPRAARSPRPRAPRAPPSSRSRSGGRTRTDRTAAAGRSSGGARCSSPPCCAASRPCACPCTRAPTRPSRSRRAAASRTPSTRDEPVVGDAEDERRVAAPAVRVVVHVLAGRDEEAALGEIADDLVRGLGRREAVQPAVVVVEVASLVDGRQHRQAERAPELEVLTAAAGRDVDDAGALLERDLVPRDDAVLDARARARGCRTALRSASPTSSEPGARRTNASSGKRAASTHSPFSRRPYSPSGLHRRGDVRRQRPRRRRPDDERLARPVEQREAHEERRVASSPGRRPTASARAGRATCRSAGTTRSRGGPCRASRARARSSGTARCTRCSCR